ncbi:MAG: hypothetical protein IT353_06495 [Gemmatimonadaceae bacterium]|nr:hypothetical protein [Gemmatimonadaceae bacterium]
MSLRHHPIAAQRERNVQIRAAAEQIAQSSQVGPTGRSLPLVVLPANTRETAPVPAELRGEFMARLRAAIAADAPAHHDRTVASASASETTVAATAFAATPTREEEIEAIFGLGCATCRGECCTAGGNHAFLRGESIPRIREAHRHLGDDELAGEYEASIPVRHYRGSCVFHTIVGCALPRTLRSDLCNRYVCGGLTQLRHALEASEGNTAFVGAADSAHLRRLALVDPTAAVHIPLT